MHAVCIPLYKVSMMCALQALCESSHGNLHGDSSPQYVHVLCKLEEYVPNQTPDMQVIENSSRSKVVNIAACVQISSLAGVCLGLRV